MPRVVWRLARTESTAVRRQRSITAPYMILYIRPVTTTLVQRDRSVNNTNRDRGSRVRFNVRTDVLNLVLFEAVPRSYS